MPQVGVNFRGGDELRGGSEEAIQFPARVTDELKPWGCRQDCALERFPGLRGQKEYAVFRIERSFPFGIVGMTRDESDFPRDAYEYWMWAGIWRVDGLAFFARRADRMAHNHGVTAAAWDPSLIVAPLAAPTAPEEILILCGLEAGLELEELV
jgi:hypothetical protein